MRRIQVPVVFVAVIASWASMAYAQSLRVDPANPRWFSYESSPLVLSGNGLWLLIPTDSYDLAEHNRHTVTWGGNSNRASLFSFCNDGVCPWERTGPGKANDGRPKFDLTKFNRAYWERAARYFRDCQKQGIFPLVQVWGECYCEGAPGGPDRWNKHPFNPDNNVNDLPGLPRGIADADRDDCFYNTGNAKLMALQDAFVTEALDRFGKFPVIWDIGNEVGLDTQLSDRWLRHWADFFDAYEKRHPGIGILSTVDCNVNNGHYDRIKNFDVINIHGAHGPYQSNPFHLKGRPDQDPHVSRVHVKKLQSNLDHWFSVYQRPLVNSRITSDPDRQRKLNDRPGNALETRHILWGYFFGAAHFISFRNDQEHSWAPQSLTTERQQVNLRKFIDSFAFGRCVPRIGGIVTTPNAVVLAEAGRQYAFYAPSGRRFTADLSEAGDAEFRARWFDPRKGVFGEPFKVHAGPAVEFPLPTEADWALLLTRYEDDENSAKTSGVR